MERYACCMCGDFPSLIGGNLIGVLNRHLRILPERFAKKDLNLVIVCHKDVTS